MSSLGPPQNVQLLLVVEQSSIELSGSLQAILPAAPVVPCLCHTPPMHSRNSHPHAEYCARGSLYDVLKAGAQDPARAAELTMKRRISMVSSITSGMATSRAVGAVALVAAAELLVAAVDLAVL